MNVEIKKQVSKDTEKLPIHIQLMARRLKHRKDAYKKHNLPWRK